MVPELIEAGAGMEGSRLLANHRVSPARSPAREGLSACTKAAPPPMIGRQPRHFLYDFYHFVYSG
jgi:hypothetical protein